MGNETDVRQERLRALPAVQILAGDPALESSIARFGREAVLDGLKESLAGLRAGILDGHITSTNLRAVAIAQTEERLSKRFNSGIQRVINATGVILHTGLGRAVLPKMALDEIVSELGGYAAVEVDVESGKRGHRDEAMRDMLKALLGCEHATVVNNNAAMTMLALAAIARGREVIVSRGQLVEIGGSFRVPDVMRESGCTLVEVGTTNRTYVRDYEAAITPNTAALMVVHTSNFRVIGFTEEPVLADLAALAHKHNLPLIHDIGSGALLSGLAAELREEPVVKASLDDGADLVLFSADKILGGPQGGIAAGRAELVEKLRRHPLYRALRVDKLTLRVLETTLRLYANSERREKDIPTLRMLCKPLFNLQAAAAALSERLAVNSDLKIDCADDSSRLGSGSLPERNIPTRVVRVTSKTISPDEIAARLRAHTPPIFARIQDDRVLIDPRTLMAGDEDEIVAALV